MFVHKIENSHSSRKPSQGNQRRRPAILCVVLLEATLAKLDRIVDNISQGKGAIGELIYDDTLYKRANATVGELQILAKKLNDGHGTIGKLLNDETMYNKLNGTEFNGNTVMYNLFSAYPNISTYITFLLTRSNLGVSDGGIFTIGETDPNWTKVLDQPQLPVLEKTHQWITLMDGVTVNGKNYTGHGML